MLMLKNHNDYSADETLAADWRDAYLPVAAAFIGNELLKATVFYDLDEERADDARSAAIDAAADAADKTASNYVTLGTSAGPDPQSVLRHAA